MSFATLLFLLSIIPHTGAQPAHVLSGRVVDGRSGTALTDADVRLVRRGTARTDGTGMFAFEGVPSGRVRITIERIGYLPLDTTMHVQSDTFVVLPLSPQPFLLESVVARGLSVRESRQGRELFNAEVQPALVGMSRQDLADVPALGERDLLRSLQALPGVVRANDLSAALHVMGGGPDENLFLWDGARVFAPYHMFGILGAFPVAAIDGVEFYRGSIPARFGNGLSSVVDIRQGGRGDSTFADATVSALAGSMTAGGALPGGGARMLGGGRRTYVNDLAWGSLARTFPYQFHDAHGRLDWTPSSAHRLQASFLVSRDVYEPFTSYDLHSEWGNDVASGSWTWVKDDGWSVKASGTWSGYDGSIEIGEAGRRPVVNSVGLGIATIEGQHEAGTRLLRIGVGAEAGRVRLHGTPDAAGYVQGSRSTPVRGAFAFGELDARWLGVRWSPGLRLRGDPASGRFDIEPRASARYDFDPQTSITLGAGRTVQWLYTIRDARNLLPGAPLWIGSTEGQPSPAAHTVSVSLARWQGPLSFDLGLYQRRLYDTPHWSPQGDRTLATLQFDDGRAHGVQLMARGYGDRLSGWFGYGYADVVFESSFSNEEYHPPWDRRHSVEAALFFRWFEWAQLSSRLSYGSGTPFWPFLGYVTTPQLNTITGHIDWQHDYFSPVWAQEQLRMPAFFKLDLGAEARFDLWGGHWKPFVHLLNVTGRPNVLYYDFTVPRDARNAPLPGFGDVRLVPVSESPITSIPTVGVHVVF